LSKAAEISVTILGSNSAVPAHGRHPTAQLIRLHGSLNLIDCGEGTQLRLQHFKIHHGKIDRIFISHLHGDHVLGLAPLLTTWQLTNRERPLHIYGPPGLEAMIQGIFSYTQCKLKYEVHWHACNMIQHSMIVDEANLKIYTFPLSHRSPTIGFRFNVKSGRSHELSPGQKHVTSDENTHSNFSSYAYCSDTAYDERILPFIKGVDYIYHEATFVHRDVDKAHRTGHSTTIEAAEMAKQCHAGSLIIGHFSARYADLTPLLEEARSVFENTYIAVEGETYHVTN
jgi:ribonuclease Z